MREKQVISTIYITGSLSTWPRCVCVYACACGCVVYVCVCGSWCLCACSCVVCVCVGRLEKRKTIFFGGEALVLLH